MATRNYIYELFILCLCVIALLQLAAVTFFTVDEAAETILFYTDFLICIIFLADFAYRLLKAPSKWRYLITWGWIDLVSSIPAIDVLRWARIVRVLRIIRVLRGVRSMKELSAHVLARRADSALTVMFLLVVVLLIVSSIAVLQFETMDQSNILTAQDALWWSFVTMTTVGYGDIYPVTVEGRILACLLMVAGIGLFGTITGYLATRFTEPGEVEQERELEMVRKRLEGIEAKLEELLSRGA